MKGWKFVQTPFSRSYVTKIQRDPEYFALNGFTYCSALHSAVSFSGPLHIPHTQLASVRTTRLCSTVHRQSPYAWVMLLLNYCLKQNSIRKCAFMKLEQLLSLYGWDKVEGMFIWRVWHPAAKYFIDVYLCLVNVDRCLYYVEMLAAVCCQIDTSDPLRPAAWL